MRLVLTLGLVMAVAALPAPMADAADRTPTSANPNVTAPASSNVTSAALHGKHNKECERALEEKCGLVKDDWAMCLNCEAENLDCLIQAGCDGYTESVFCGIPPGR